MSAFGGKADMPAARLLSPLWSRSGPISSSLEWCDLDHGLPALLSGD